MYGWQQIDKQLYGLTNSSAYWQTTLWTDKQLSVELKGLYIVMDDPWIFADCYVYIKWQKTVYHFI